MTEESRAGKSQESVAPKPPDGGWGWAVVFGSFVIHVIADGVYYSFGVFLVALLDYFEGAGRGELGWVGSIMIGTLLIVGPLASMLTNAFGCRAVVIVGTIITFIGFILSIWAPNVYFLYFSFGILGGTGLGFVYLPAIVSISFYFEERRAFATGIAVCGSGIGTFIFAPLSQFLLNEFGWKGAVLIEAGLMLNCIVAGLLFRPVEAIEPKSAVTAEEAKCLAADPDNVQLKVQISQLKDGSTSMNTIPIAHLKENDGRMHKSDLHLHTKSGKSETKSHHHQSTPHTPKVIRKDAYYTGSLHNIPMYREHRDEYTRSMVSVNRDRNATKLEPTKETKSCSCLSEQNKKEIKESMDFALFKDVLFQMFAWSNFLTNFAFFVPYIFLPDKAQLEGIDKNSASSLVSMIGISNTIGRLLFGWLADRKFVNRLMLYNTAVLIAGVATALSALAYNYVLLSVYSCVYGCLIGVYVTLTPIIIVDLLGIEKLSNAFGLVLFFQGAATFIGPPIAGWFYDSTGSYTWPFVLFGVLLAVSGIMLYPIPCISKCLERRKGVDQHDVDMGKQVTNMEYVAVKQAEANSLNAA